MINIHFHKNLRSKRILAILIYIEKSQLNLFDFWETQVAIYSRFISRVKVLKVKKQNNRRFHSSKVALLRKANRLYYKRFRQYAVPHYNLFKRWVEMESRSDIC